MAIPPHRPNSNAYARAPNAPTSTHQCRIYTYIHYIYTIDVDGYRKDRMGMRVRFPCKSHSYPHYNSNWPTFLERPTTSLFSSVFKFFFSLLLPVALDQACIARPRRSHHLLHDLDHPTCQTVTKLKSYRDHIATLALSDLIYCHKLNSNYTTSSGPLS